MWKNCRVTSSARRVFLLLSLIQLTACAHPFIDPSIRTVEYTSLNHPSRPQPLLLTVHFQTNGNSNGMAESLARDAITHVFQVSGTFTPVKSADLSLPRMDVVINNVADTGNAVASGFGTGMTFGAVGSLVVDDYILTLHYQPPHGSPLDREYKHAIYSTIGNHEPPSNFIRMDGLQEPFNRVIEDMMLRALLDIQLSSG